MTGCISQKQLEIKNVSNFPQTFKEAEIWFEKQFQPIEICNSKTAMFISSEGDTTYVNCVDLTQLIDTSNTKSTDKLIR